jgi:glycosyltransferase involved in cell wall biosynthesis
MKIAVLWMGLSGYLNACLKELAGRDKVELFVCHRAPESNAPFDENLFAWMTNRFVWKSDRDLEDLAPKLREFAPDILIFSGWHVPAYRRAARELANKCWRVMAMDRCWLATLKQRIGTWVAPYFVHPLADAVWLPGERQAAFARKLGFRQQVIMRGLYACDQPVVEVSHTARISEGRPVPRSFLFIGRFVPEKCIDTLANAYLLYREGNPEPWPLVCCGTGPFRSMLEGKIGIRVEGFVQPDRLPETLASAGCLILPSLFEPWALVVHEAASAGLVILASEEVGAVPHLVQPGYNGFIFDNRDVVGLATLMGRVAAMSDARLDNMSRSSFALSRQFSPSRWADTLLESFCALSRDPSTRGCSPDDMLRDSRLQHISGNSRSEVRVKHLPSA